MSVLIVFNTLLFFSILIFKYYCQRFILPIFWREKVILNVIFYLFRQISFLLLCFSCFWCFGFNSKLIFFRLDFKLILLLTFQLFFLLILGLFNFVTFLASLFLKIAYKFFKFVYCLSISRCISRINLKQSLSQGIHSKSTISCISYWCLQRMPHTIKANIIICFPGLGTTFIADLKFLFLPKLLNLVLNNNLGRIHSYWKD